MKIHQHYKNHKNRLVRKIQVVYQYQLANGNIGTRSEGFNVSGAINLPEIHDYLKKKHNLVQVVILTWQLTRG